MKTIQFILLILVAGICIRCSNDDNSNTIVPETKTIDGSWEHTSGIILDGSIKFISIDKEKGILIMLFENEFGFRGIKQYNVTIDESNINFLTPTEISEFGYTLDKNELKITLRNNTATFKRLDTDLNLDNWVKTLTILQNAVVPFKDIDIAFDGSSIIGYSEEDRGIIKINPETLAIESVIATTLTPKAVEIEKSDTNPLLFQADTGNIFRASFYSTGETFYTSIDNGGFITGLASEKPGYTWVATNNNDYINRYKSNGSLNPGEILQQIDLGFYSINGLDFQGGYLYVAGGQYLYKCQVIPEFEVIEAYRIPGYAMKGVAFDGTNFWLNAQGEDNAFHLLKSDLTL
ncbi:hypothetical protein [Aquimarina macrocephali]|uniref:hypothetical protein n=1 Tax=Aquimarina macrocephali TaxID=666563 RepID=UPI000466DBF8|nr:hypothetical protein [Aquimarina macrocephali]